jgi:hypothetical protein
MGDVAKTVVAILLAAAIIAVAWAGWQSVNDSNDFNDRQQDQFQQP